MSEKHTDKPYKALGSRLKQLRERLHESVAEVSGAVEIDTIVLEQIEQGTKRPSEDVLMLLMSHFNMPEDESVKLWELAGYNRPKAQSSHAGSVFDLDDIKPQVVMLMQADTRVIYSDMAQVTVNNHGVVLNFMQTGSHSQPVTVSRIGMSREHAQSVLELLHHSLNQASQLPKYLPAPEESDSQQSE